MSLKEERMQILKMLEEGKITADEAATLLSALETGAKKEETTSRPGETGQKARWLRVRVTDQDTGKQKVTVNLPMGMVNVAVKMGAKFAPDVEDLDMDTIVEAIKSGAQGKIVDIEDNEEGERVEIFVE
jgi:hypothetical protein